MPISLLVRERFGVIDDIILGVCRRLLREVGDIIVRVDSFDDGPSIRVVVRKKDWRIVDRIVEIVRDFERENNIETPLIVHVDYVDEISVEQHYSLDTLLLRDVENFLRKELGDIIVRVDGFDDGPSIRVVVKRKSWGIIDRIIRTVRDFEEENMMKTPLIVYVDEIDEV